MAEKQWGNPVISKISPSEGLRVKAGKTIWLEGEVPVRETVGRREGLPCKLKPGRRGQKVETVRAVGLQKRGWQWGSSGNTAALQMSRNGGLSEGGSGKAGRDSRNCQVPY